MQTREQVETKYKWDLSSYFENEQQFEQALKELDSTKDCLCRFENNLKTRENIFDCLLLSSKQSLLAGKLYVYSALVTKQDQGDSNAQERLERVSNILTQISANNSFVDVELSALNNDFLTELSNDKQYPQFSEVFKSIIREKQHTLSKAEERLLSLMSDFTGGFSDNFDKFDDADLTFDDVVDKNGNKLPLNHANYQKYIYNSDRTLRKSTYQVMNGTYGKFNNFLASNYISNTKLDVFSSKIRGFENCLQASMFYEEVDPKVYETLILQVNNNLDKLQSYLKLKQKSLKQQDFGIYDLHAPVSDFGKKYTYDQAFEIVKNATSVLGSEYTSLLQRAKDERWIDVMPNKNKDSGAYSWGAYGALPVVSLNFVGDSNSMFTLAHELGHCMHTYFSNKNQPQEKAGYTIFVAEVASTVNEMLLCQYLLKNAQTNQEKAYYCDYLLGTATATIFRQTEFSQFEKIVHDYAEKGLPLSKDILNKTYMDLQKKYYGKDVEQLPEMQYEWSRIPHFYNSFYVYKYATGLISAMAITKKILSGEKDAVQNYLKFLTLGCSLDPVKSLCIAGSDLTNPKTFQDGFDYMGEIVAYWKSLT